MSADPRPRAWYDDEEDDGERPGRLCPDCSAGRTALGHGFAALAVLAVAAAAFAVAYQLL
jgi:hypothetical protein